MIFRSLKSIKLLRISACTFDNVDHELIFELVQQNEITRKYRFRYYDCEVMSAVFDERSCSSVQAKPKLFAQLLGHIHQSPEVSLLAGPEFFNVRSFHKLENLKSNDTNAANAAAGGANRFMSTGLNVNLQEMDKYLYVSEYESEELIFCVKEVTEYSISSTII